MSIYSRLAGAKSAERRSYFGGTGSCLVTITSIQQGTKRKGGAPYIVFRARVEEVIGESASAPLTVRPGQEASAFYTLDGTDRGERDLERAKSAFLACLGLTPADVSDDGFILVAGEPSDLTLESAMERLGANNGAAAVGLQVYLDLETITAKESGNPFTTSSWRPLG